MIPKTNNPDPKHRAKKVAWEKKMAVQKILKCGDFRLSTPIIYEIMEGDPCCQDCHRGKHREFGQRVGFKWGKHTYTVCCKMTSFCIKNGKEIVKKKERMTMAKYAGQR